MALAFYGGPCAADGYARLGSLYGANFNTTADQAIPIFSASSNPRYIVRRITVQNCSANLTLAAGGFYTAASKGGTAIVAAAQLYSALTSSEKFLEVTLASVATTDIMTVTTIYLSLTTGQGSAAVCDVAVFGDILT